MKRLLKSCKAILPLLLALALVLTPVLATSAYAATTAEVEINATPSYISIANSPSVMGFGTVAVSTNYSTGIAWFNVTNASSVTTDVTISCNATWAGGNDWTHDDTGTPGSTTAALYASPGTGAFDIIVKNATPNDVIASQAATTDWDWELRLMSPTVYDDGVQKFNTVTLTASAS